MKLGKKTLILISSIAIVVALLIYFRDEINPLPIPTKVNPSELNQPDENSVVDLSITRDWKIACSYAEYYLAKNQYEFSFLWANIAKRLGSDIQETEEIMKSSEEKLYDIERNEQRERFDVDYTTTLYMFMRRNTHSDYAKAFFWSLQSLNSKSNHVDKEVVESNLISAIGKYYTNSSSLARLEIEYLLYGKHKDPE